MLLLLCAVMQQAVIGKPLHIIIQCWRPYPLLPLTCGFPCAPLPAPQPCPCCPCPCCLPRSTHLHHAYQLTVLCSTGLPGWSRDFLPVRNLLLDWQSSAAAYFCTEWTTGVCTATACRQSCSSLATFRRIGCWFAGSGASHSLSSWAGSLC